MWNEKLQCKTERHLTLGFTLVFLLRHAPTVSFYFLMKMFGCDYERVEVGFAC